MAASVPVLIIIVFAISGLGIGIGYLIYIKTREKKMTWDARVYQVGRGVRPPIKDDKGKIVSNLELNDLKPYGKDVIEKTYKGKNIVVFRLQKMNKTVENVPSDCVESWGEKKEVSVILEGDTCTVMNVGYDSVAGKVFQPMKHDRLNLVTSEIEIRKDRVRQHKDILQAILPYVAIAVGMITLVMLAWINVDGFLEMQEQANIQQDKNNDALVTAAKLISGKDIDWVGEESDVQEEPPLIPG